MLMKKALVTGITGQDGSYLAELLLEKGYEVHGIVRRASTFNTDRLDHLYKDPLVDNTNLYLHYGDLADGVMLMKLLYNLQPDEVYHLGAQSHVRVSFDVPEYTGDVTGLGTLRLLEAIRELGLERKCRFYQASSSEMFGMVQHVPQTEKTPFYPRSPYGCAKVYAYWLTVNYRESYNMHATNGILFNHESPRRGETFVTRKITRAATRIKLGLQDKLYLGNLDAQRDWGYAKEYVEAMWLMLQQDEPRDYVIATGQCYTIREFVNFAFLEVGIHISWEGVGLGEVGKDSKTGNVLVRIDEKYFRPAEVELLLGDSSKAEKELGWKATTTLKEMVSEMVQYDLDHDDYGFNNDNGV